LNNNLLVNSSWLFQKNDSPFNFSKITFESAKVTSEKETSITADELVADKGSHFTLVEDQNINIPLIFIKGSSNIISSGKENLMTDTIDLSGNSILSIVPEQTLSLKVKNLNIASGAYLSASGSGYIDGPGVSSYYYAGASYGGVGGDNVAESVYGNELEPTDFGSGGANNFRGGGAIRLIVTDTLLNNGVIDADGDTTSSGGSIYVTAKNISGNGYFWANGGGPFCPNNCFKPGGGGRIAIYYENYLFTGQVLADGCSSGVGNSTGGTVKLIDTDAPDI
jgi:hypothetical protein